MERQKHGQAARLFQLGGVGGVSPGVSDVGSDSGVVAIGEEDTLVPE
jgi:hypothetical protein